MKLRTATVILGALLVLATGAILLSGTAGDAQAEGDARAEDRAQPTSNFSFKIKVTEDWIRTLVAMNADSQGTYDLNVQVWAGGTLIANRTGTVSPTNRSINDQNDVERFRARLTENGMLQVEYVGITDGAFDHAVGVRVTSLGEELVNLTQKVDPDP